MGRAGRSADPPRAGRGLPSISRGRGLSLRERLRVFARSHARDKVCCNPKRCAAYGTTCGTALSNECGRTQLCDCSELGLIMKRQCNRENCGASIPDGCGGTLDCSDICLEGELCDSTTSQCVCPLPGSCAAINANCGTLQIDCLGNTTSCGGACPCGQACGVDHRCRPIELDCGADVSCGFVCTSTLATAPADPWCGAAAQSARAASRPTNVRRARSSAGDRWPSSPTQSPRASIAFSRSRSGAGCGSTTRPSCSSPMEGGCSRHARIPLIGQTRVSTSGYERIESTMFPPRVPKCPSMVGTPCLGTAFSQFVRRESLSVASEQPRRALVAAGRARDALRPTKTAELSAPDAGQQDADLCAR